MSTTPDITLREATADDVPVILRCIRGLAEYERLAHECIANEELLRASLFGESPAAHVELAMAGGEAAGFALWFRNYSTFLARPGIYLEDLFVFPAFRGRGIGRRLLQHLAQLAVSRGYGRLEWAVLDWNTPSIEFYKAQGAVPLDEWTVFRLTDDALHEFAGRRDAEDARPA